MTNLQERNRLSMRGRRGGGFTLVELLVVIGIIVVLVSIMTPIVMTARRNADRVRTRGDLNTIALALEAYKNDFRDYPRPDAATPTTPVLAWALVGPCDAVTGPLPPPWSGTGSGDGADGPGFRTQWDNTNKVGSKVWGPYLPPDKFKIDFDTSTTPATVFLLDRFGSRIEYFPQWRSAKPGVKLFGVTSGDPLTSLAGAGGGVYDCRQAALPQPADATNNPTPGQQAVYYLQRSLGDGVGGAHDDLIGAGEKLLVDPPPFILMSRGYSKMYSPKVDVDQRFDKTSEVTNLQTP